MIFRAPEMAGNALLILMVIAYVIFFNGNMSKLKKLITEKLLVGLTLLGGPCT
jgi:hypothetical protein